MAGEMHPPGKKTIAQLEESIQKAETNPISQAIRLGNWDFWEGRLHQPKPPPVGVRSRKVGHATNMDLVVDLDRYYDNIVGGFWWC